MQLLLKLNSNLVLKKVVAIILILLICFSFFVPAPPAEAIIIDSAIAVAISIVVSTALVGIGVSATTEHEEFDALVEDVCSYLIDAGVAQAKVSLAVINQIAYVPVRIVNAIKDYLFDEGILYNDVSTFAMSSNYENYTSASALGAIFDSDFECLGRFSINSVDYVSVSDFFNSSSVPAVYQNIYNAYVNTGANVSNLKFASCYYSPNLGYNILLSSYVYCYVYNKIDLTVRNYPNVVLAGGLNCIRCYMSNGSVISSYRQNWIPASSDHEWSEVYVNCGSFDGGGICSDAALDINQSLQDGVGVDELYPDWAANEQAYTQDNADVVGLPLTVPDSYSDVYGLDQAGAWAGDIATSLSGVDTNVGTIADAIPGILTNTGSIATSVSDVLTQVTSIADFLTGSVVVASPMSAINFSNLFDLFPFNIPYQIIDSLSSWVAEASPPDLSIPLPSFDDGFHIYVYDFNMADIPNMPLASAMCRGGWMLIFTIGLYKITSQVIKW